MKKTVVAITIKLGLIFAVMAYCGGYMLYQQQNASPVASDVKVSAKKDSLSIELKNALPGLIVFCFGAGGLILLVIKIPVHEVLGYHVEGGGHSGGIGMMTRKKVISKHIISMPLPVWWLLRPTGKFEKALSRKMA
jgi:hypothetical protein